MTADLSESVSLDSCSIILLKTLFLLELFANKCTQLFSIHTYSFVGSVKEVGIGDHLFPPRIAGSGFILSDIITSSTFSLSSTSTAGPMAPLATLKECDSSKPNAGFIDWLIGFDLTNYI